MLVFCLICRPQCYCIDSQASILRGGGILKNSVGFLRSSGYKGRRNEKGDGAKLNGDALLYDRKEQDNLPLSNNP